jgi:hypothetical protein
MLLASCPAGYLGGKAMFGWLKRRSTRAPEQAPSAPIASMPPPPRRSEAAPAAQVAPPAAPRKSANGHHRPSRWNASRALPPKGYKEPPPAAGMVAIEIAPPRVRQAVVTRVLADGRRVMARIGGSARSCWYTRREDGTYRLESAPKAKAPRLVLGLELAPGKRAYGHHPR